MPKAIIKIEVTEFDGDEVPLDCESLGRLRIVITAAYAQVGNYSTEDDFQSLLLIRTGKNLRQAMENVDELCKEAGCD